MLLIMSTAASTSIAHFSTPASLHLSTAKNKKAALLLNSIPTSKITSPPSISKVQYGYGYSKKSSILTGFKPFSSPVMEWQDCTVKMEIDVPVGVAYKLYSDRESIPRWMPFISSVQVLKDKPDLSRWSLKYKALGQELEYSWLARNMQPTPNQKIHWRSLEGLPNRGSVRFFPRGSSSCQVELTVSYEVPQILTPLAAALQPLLESLLRGGLEKFATLAKTFAD
ncbi:POLYKETIDE CYCLASE/DEHYDRASE AND LIPID TRANSPORT SUPERFAMILY PROTEIN [Salix purpurea]|uniref:POLYKETIDE CYCLASE/DEHYDRASE AND LIPID TRANSPORT SUPERFAMILY PROTEIN n=1 Tax=Salix purpurea TaxID=77065 RepID=A0A9Q0P1T8_SALPP|nr:POLYKETIDE CYCLASE/DEHYDRASE AND LIPID TRANSPORT SUPERFAMILY PROTEIN [Salix purpurea]